MITEKERIYYELLVLRCRKSDTKAQEELIHHFEKRLFYYLRRLVNEEEDAWDLLQETWIKVIKSIGQLKEPGKLPIWLYSIARNTAISHFRKNKTMQFWTEEQGSLHPNSESSSYFSSNMDSANTFSQEEMDKVHNALGQLSLSHREVLTLHFLEDLPVEEIARIIEVPLGTVKSRMYYAKESLREILRKEESNQ